MRAKPLTQRKGSFGALAVALLCAAVILGLAPSARADFLPHGTYTLGSHPSTGDNPPPLGLRLDRLFDTPGKFAFDFNHSLSNMQMTWDGTNIHIFGDAYGGHDGGTVFANDGYQGVYQVDFTYRATVTEFASGDVALLVEFDPALNNGSITSPGTIPGGEQTVALWDRGDPTNNSFYLAYNHRGFAGLSGYGWLDFPGRPDHALADWLFTAELNGGGGGPNVIPAPGAVILAAMGLGTMGFVRRRRLRPGQE
jgi:hypothetical protein